MQTIDPVLKFFLNLTMVQAVMGRRFDAKLCLHSVSLNDLMILLHLNNAPERRLRRIDLAEKVGLTASGVTRLLAPLEKIGMVKSEAAERDARVRYVKLAKGGQRILKEATATAEAAANYMFQGDTKRMEEATKLLIELGGSIN
ncbi:MarR family winged helix-turn-helix transcriptional regulator [Arachidicoccus sp.]|uniref:MarR family winged helix-turn-helix transcriptional regulator n=1 Tax=Arachidicoccus sp. TaxID=1872624 RepID=UPI003D259901